MISNGYTVYQLRILAAQGMMASVYADKMLPDEFTAGLVEAVDSQHVLMCELSPWGYIDGWRVRRNQDIMQILYGEEYEERLGMLMAQHQEQHRYFFPEPQEESEGLLLRVLLRCKETQELVSILIGDDVITGRVAEANELNMRLNVLDFFGREAGEETFPLRDIELLEVGTQEEKMYLELEEMAKMRNAFSLPDQP